MDDKHRITALEARIAALEARLANLEASRVQPSIQPQQLPNWTVTCQGGKSSANPYY